MRPLTWDNPEDIALALMEEFPAQDPLQVRFTDLHRWVTELEGFAGAPDSSTEGHLEAIQMAWYDDWQNR
jgi:FeS assembly protein IscX